MPGGRTIDALDLARELIRCPSVTPEEGGALSLLETVLSGLGFACHRLPFGEPDSVRVDNLYARFGQAKPNFCFAGHSDVVPVGERGRWSADPFGAEIRDGYLYGRGAVDMKGAIACFVTAVSLYLAETPKPAGSISLLITGDEEGPSINGTKKVLDWLEKRGEAIDAALVGEPTNPTNLGDMIKIGRRGSLNGVLTVHGIQGHAAYPHLADNPVHRLIGQLRRLLGQPLDRGSEHFQPSSLQITSIDVGNPTTNVIPGSATARFNIRFNDQHTGVSLERSLRESLDAAGIAYELDVKVGGEAFLTPPGSLSALIAEAVREVTGLTPALSTTGGTSDARFIRHFCPVAEFGLISQTMHQCDERVRLSDLETLTRIYGATLRRFFGDS